MSSIVDATLTDVLFNRPEGFDLPAWWAMWRAGHEKGRPAVPSTLKISPAALPRSLERFAAALRILEADGDRAAVSITSGSVPELRGQLLAYGGAIGVMAPQSLRRSMADFAKRIGGRCAGRFSVIGVNMR